MEEEKAVRRLNSEIMGQDFHGWQSSGEIEEYRQIARNYARVENCIAVLSDMRSDCSFIYYGGFAKTLGLEGCRSGMVDSVWEKDLLRRMHPDDLGMKYRGELSFFRFVKRQPPEKRGSYYLAGFLRMRNSYGAYVPVVHRLFYIPSPHGSLWLALCLYGPLPAGTLGKCLIVNSENGETMEAGNGDSVKILSAREAQILQMVDKGMTSKDIASRLSISVNTVSRHRQAILAKLKVGNSIEACRMAKSLDLL